MGRESRGVAAAALLAAALVAVLVLPGLGTAPFDDPGEGQHAEIAREVGRTGDWLTLRLNGVRYFDKPPFLYWLIAGAFALVGPSEWAARLAPALGAIAAVMGTALLGARLLGPRMGVLAGGALASSALFVAFARYVRPETLFVAAIQWGMTGLLLASVAGRPARAGRRWALLGCAALGLASLIKDPLGLLGPLVAVGLALGLAGRRRPITTWLPPSGAAVLLLVGFGWYALAALLNPGFLWYTVVDNHVLNVARSRQFPDEDVPLTAMEFLAVSGLGILPWIIPAGLTVGSLVRGRAWRDPDEIPWTALALWSTGALLLLAVAPFRLPHYALPTYPAICLLAVRAWQERRARPRALIALHLGLFALIALTCALVAAGDGRLFADTVLSATDVQARKAAAAGEAGAAAIWLTLQPLVARTALVFATASLGLLIALALGRAGLGLAVVLVSMLAAMPVVVAALSAVSATRAVAGMAAEVKRVVGPGDLLIHEGPIESSGALEFYSGLRPILLDARRSVLGFGATLPDAQGMFWDAHRFQAEWRSGRRLFLVTPRSPERSLVRELPPSSVHLLASQGGRRLYGNGAAASRVSSR